MRILLIAWMALLCLVGCSIPEYRPPMTEAQHIIRSGAAECILLPQEGDMIAKKGRGVSPLLEMYDEHGEAMADGIICDKVIGRATAAIAICGKVRHVHSELMSEDAAAFLNAHGITASATTFVPLILNRKMDGRCPMEMAVDGIEDPAEAVAALRLALEAMRTQKEVTP